MIAETSTRRGAPLALVLAAALIPVPHALAAQRLAPGAFERAVLRAPASAPPAFFAAEDTVRLPGTAATIGLGLLGGIGGLMVGVLAGSAVDRARGCDECDEWGTAAGALVGSSIGIAGGVHLVHNARGRFLPVVAWTTGMMTLAFAGSWAISRAGEDVDLLVLPASFLAATWAANRAEHATMPPHAAPATAAAGGPD